MEVVVERLVGGCGDLAHGCGVVPSGDPSECEVLRVGFGRVEDLDQVAPGVER